MEKTPYLRMIFAGIGFGLIAVFVAWTVVYWQDAITLSESEQYQYMDGKGIANRGDNFYCSNLRGRIYKCDFSKALDIYSRLTFTGIMILPMTLTHTNLYFYVFYSAVIVAFLSQFVFFKATNKWKKHLEKSHTGLKRDF